MTARRKDRRDAPGTHPVTATGRRVARNFAFSAVGMLVATPLNVVGMLILARRLGPETVGLCFAVFAIAIGVFMLSGMGVPTVLARKIAAAPHRYRKRAGEAAGLYLIVVAAATVAMAVCGSIWLSVQDVPSGVTLFALATAAVACRHAIEFSVGVVVGLERFEFEMLTRLVQNGTFCLLAATTVTPGPDAAVHGVAAFAVSHLIAAVFIVSVLVFRFGCRRVGISVADAKLWLYESAVLGWGDAMRGLGWNIDSVILSLIGTPRAVGLYNVAYRPLMPLRIVPRTLVNVTFPMMSRQADSDREALRRSSRKSFALLWFVSLPICIAVTALAEPLVALVAGEDFAGAAAPLQVLIWVTPLLFWNTQFRFLFAAIGELSEYSRMVTSALVVKVLLLLGLTPAFGLFGACAAALLAEASALGLGLRVVARQRLGWPSLGQLAATLPGAAVMGGCLYAASGAALLVQLLCVLAATLAYFVIGLWFGAVDRTEVRRVLDRLRVRFRGLPLPEDLPEGQPSAGAKA